MESCLGTIKTELEMECYENERVARAEIGGYIRYYNTRRRHSALDYRTPEEFEAAAATAGRRGRRGKHHEVARNKMGESNGTQPGGCAAASARAL